MTNNIWRNLAELAGPCPECGDSGRGKPTLAEPDGAEGGCPACHGKGEVALIEGLRKPCERCKGTGTCYHLTFGGNPRPEDAYPCPACSGTGWLVVDGDRAILAAQEYILSLTSENGWWGFVAEHSDDGIIVTIADERRVLGMSDSQPTYRAALAQALERALEQEKP